MLLTHVSLVEANTHRSCACDDTSSYFIFEKVTTDPEVISRCSIIFSLHGKLLKAVKSVKVTAISSYCVSGNCIPLDTRPLDLENDANDFDVGSVEIRVRTEIPSYAPFGGYNVRLVFEGNIDGKYVQFACAESDFDL